MSKRVCEVCGKSYLKGNLVPTGIGGRVTNRAIKRQQPNIRKKKLNVNGQNVTVHLCSSCLKRMKFNKKLAAKAADAE